MVSYFIFKKNLGEKNVQLYKGEKTGPKVEISPWHIVRWEKKSSYKSKKKINQSISIIMISIYIFTTFWNDMQPETVQCRDISYPRVHIFSVWDYRMIQEKHYY